MLDNIINALSEVTAIPHLSRSALSTLARVLLIREKFANFYAGKTIELGPGPDKQEADASDTRHRYFIRVLRKAYDLLSKVEAPAKEVTNSDTGVKKEKKPDLVNIYEVLVNEDPQVPDDVPDAGVTGSAGGGDQKPKGRAAETQPKHSYHKALPTEDELLNAFCLWEDLSDLRSYLGK
ncbi:hypothetical protein HK097_003415 [Rhizophlyctis rosea]|uniref:DUF6604 domain-containing protein n=1 Tax=Rhizophlyctis rosea TaxID=64517 RepID=A0AAD5X2Z8_9FUNG|nr:hypothetical protein HK097_003415 [Rhizophlyctis rosea]